MRENDPYRIPDDGFYRAINVSGGRSSGYMLRNILDANGGRLPDRTVAVFCNTGKEHPATLDFVREIERRWGQPIVWLEYERRQEVAGGRNDPKNVHRVVSWETASRHGEPFAAMIASNGFLPSRVRRQCTSDLKVETVSRYVRRDLGWETKKIRNVLGIRHDEPRRWKKALMEECKTEYPMVHAGVGVEDVDLWWASQSFGLAITRWQGNCDLCFMKSDRKLLSLLRDDPSLADWWIGQEESNLDPGHKRRRPASFLFGGRTYRDLRDMALATPELDFGEHSEDVLDCYCGVD